MRTQLFMKLATMMAHVGSFERRRRNGGSARRRGVASEVELSLVVRSSFPRLM